jgi:hypothetical protein
MLEEAVELHIYLLEGDRIFRIYFLKRVGELCTYILEEAEELRMYLLEEVAVFHSYLLKGRGEPLPYLLEGIEKLRTCPLKRAEESQPYLSEEMVQILLCLWMGLVLREVMDVLR